LHLLNKETVRDLDARAGRSGDTGEGLAVDALISTAAGVSGNRDGTRSSGAVTNPDILILRGGGLIRVSLATVTRIQIGIIVTAGAVHDTGTRVRGIPHTIATEAKVVELVRTRRAGQVATSVQAVVTSALALRVLDDALREHGLNNERWVLATIKGRLDDGRAIQAEDNGVVRWNSSIQSVLVRWIPKGHSVNVAFIGNVRRVGLTKGPSEERHGISDSSRERVRRVDSDEGVAVVARNLAAVLPSEGSNASKTVCRDGVVLVLAQSRVASPADITDVGRNAHGRPHVSKDGKRGSRGRRIDYARRSEGAHDTRELRAVIELGIQAKINVIAGQVNASAVIRVDVSIAPVTEISIDRIAIAVLSAAATHGLAKTSAGDTARDLVVSRRTASCEGLEVTRVPVVEGVAVFGVLALVCVALANVNKV